MVQAKLQEIGTSIRPATYLLERMFPQFRERLGPALDLIVEFSTLGEYRLAANGAVRPASALSPTALRAQDIVRKRTAPEHEPRLGGAGVSRPEAAGLAGRAGYGIVARAAVRRNVAGGAAGHVPAATPAARRGARQTARRGIPRRPAAAAAAEQLCFAV